MSGEEEGYDPLRENETKKQVDYKFHTTKSQLKKLKVQETSASRHEQEDDAQGKRRSSIQTKRGYYQQTSLEVNQERAKKYWNGIDNLYFKSTNLDHLHDVLQRELKCEQIYYFLQDEYNFLNNTLSFKSYNIYEQYPAIRSQKSAIKVLFLNQEEDNRICFYQLGQYGDGIFQSNEETIPLIFNGKIKVSSSLQHYNQTKKQIELENQIILWQNLKERVESDNKVEIQKLKMKLQIPQIKIEMNDNEIELIKQKLFWSTILKLFIEGHRDKTNGVFDYYNITGDDSDIQQAFKTKKQAKKFQTDCKICFCSSNYQSNIVVYCDICNTSFHVICYGLKNIPKSQKYYCEVCTQFKLTQNKDRPNCKICEKKYFPMKKMDKHYYHVTCLVLNNFVEFRNLELRLRKDVNFKTIQNVVIESQMRKGSCYFCQSPYGFRFQCKQKGCDMSFHPICGYLNGCIFNMKRSSSIPNNLQVNVFCSNHDQRRNCIQQVYYRRYVCDYKKTSKYTLQQFKLIYHRQIMQYEQSNRKKQNPQHHILQVNKHMKDFKEKVKTSKSKGSKFKTQVGKIIKSNKN